VAQFPIHFVAREVLFLVSCSKSRLCFPDFVSPLLGLARFSLPSIFPALVALSRSIGLRFVPQVPAPLVPRWALGSFYRSAESNADFFWFGPPASFLLSSCAVDCRFPVAVHVFSVSIFCPLVFGFCGATGSISCLGFVRPKRRFAFLPVSARSCCSRFLYRRLSSVPWVHFSLLLVFLLDWSAQHAWISFVATASRCCQFHFYSEKPTSD
jgi:hypothetical protein